MDIRARVKEDKKFLRLAKEVLRQENARFTQTWVNVAEEDWPQVPQSHKKPFQVWRNNKFAAQVFQEANGILRISINKATVIKTGDWLDGFTWDELQNIKSVIGYGHRQAIEFYPQDSEVVNVANIRHLWVLPEPLPFAW